MSESAAQKPFFAERPTEFVVRDAFVLGAAPLALAGFFGILGWEAAGIVCLGFTVFVGCFFRNPMRLLPGDDRTVVAPADGRVLEAGEIDLPDGGKAVRVAIFLSVFNVHVNRAPVPGRVVSIDRGGSGFRAAFDRRAEAENARCDMVLETARGERVAVSQIAGLIARRIVCHPVVGEWVARGARYGLIRFGSRTDVVLPATAELRVAKGESVRGGRDVIAQLPRSE
ncbi:MAG: phosphatidylserine decarboxylase [Myxococcota bacterium]|nr:phosphatidylserine decarboxylase family protein [Deltaproteobacteria bacterium]MCP4240486.1 phosphatidylserine decarboxylase family protein [bacterium]MDP6076458.1 phosphatidylserine decarboxylase [Myxococcota bacterium]MDP6244359.1 phosphatidylserine decarboxylase [Myxococcota bacterium]MDP7073346.1 phosphatidylserine decarboxylase [Myxococcota bacterium]